MLHTISSEITDKTKEYTIYIDKHRANVQKAWDEVQEKCKDLLSANLSSTQLALIESNIKNHDMSKYGEEEFEPYRKWFYPVEESEKSKKEFDKAWQHHKENNLHHPDIWKERGNQDLMPYYFIVEMVCDWQAMGYVFGNNAKQYYEKEKTNIQAKLGKKQIKWTEDLLNALCK